jgi:hypothetical protein
MIAIVAGCSTNAKLLKEARESGYQADFAIVYSEVLAAVRELYPQLAEDANSGVIRTAWHPVRIQSQSAGATQDDPINTTGGNTGTTPLTTTDRRKAFFVRFRVYVVGGKPWEIRVEGEASSWEIGEIPQPMRGAEIPPWLQGRTDKLRVSIHKRLAAYAVVVNKDQVAKKPVKQAPDEKPFAALPAGAARVVATVALAARTRDLEALRAQMSDDLAWSAGATGADTAMAMYSADATILSAMSATLDKGCAAAGAEIVCPADAGAPGFRGYFARFERVDQSWKLAAFFQIE